MLAPRKAKQQEGGGGGARGRPGVTCVGPRPGVQQSDLRAPPGAARPAPHRLPQEQPHTPRGRAAEAAGRPEEHKPGLHGARSVVGDGEGGRGEPRPGPAAWGGATWGTGSCLAPSPPETPSPGAAGRAGSGAEEPAGPSRARSSRSAASVAAAHLRAPGRSPAVLEARPSSRNAEGLGDVTLVLALPPKLLDGKLLSS